MVAVYFSLLISAQALLLLSQCSGFQPGLPRLNTLAGAITHGNRIRSRVFSEPNDGEQKKETDDVDPVEKERGRFFPSFLSSLNRNRQTEERKAEQSTVSLKAVSDEGSAKSEEVRLPPVVVPPVVVPPVVELSATEKAVMLRAQADKARLEAERMDAELTLQKIERLEKDLKNAKAKGTVDSVENLQRQMAALQAKISGEAPKPVITQKKAVSTSATPESRTELSAIVSSPRTKSSTKALPKGDFFSNLPSVAEPFNQQKFDEVLSDVNNMPDFMKQLSFKQLGLDDKSEDVKVNATAIALRLDEIRRCDFSYHKGERPSFTQQDIQKMKERLSSSKNWLSEDSFIADEVLIKAAGGNETELALLCLEYEYFQEKYVFSVDRLETLVEDDEVIAAIQKMSSDSIVEQALPPCTRKEGKVPTMAQAELLLREVLPKVKFSSTSKPMACPGGFIIKGNSRAADGDALIQAIDAQLAKMPTLKGKVTVCFLNDFTFFLEDDDGGSSDAQETIIFVGGPDLAREPRKLALSATTAVGLATCWYLSLYPFLLNPNLAKRIDEQLALVDANMPTDLSWLTDLSFPLFITFVSLQLLHEFGHRAVAAFNDIKPTFPTFVPSIITGVTSLTTSFKEPPKNLQAMFDFSVAGPLFGMIGSMFAILIGAQLSLSGADASMFPALPLEILRQSSLGGGIIESVMGSGLLNIPDGAQGTQAVATMTIPLHPIAIAGYISLVVNALSMLPIGTTDGGRVAMALFGRINKQTVGGLTLFAILIAGIQGSDLFLFYYAFCLGFQKGNELPCRNEVDNVDFTRVILAIGAYFLALLALIPFQ